MKLPLFTAALLMMLRPSAPAAEPVSLESRLRPLIDAHRGQVAIAVKRLPTKDADAKPAANTGEFTYRADEVMPTASLIKFPILIELYRQAGEKDVDLDERLTLRETDKVPGSGVLTPHFSAGASFPLRDSARLMIAFSDNTATNLVLDKIGLASTSETMARLGCPNTRLHHKVYLRDTTSIAAERSQRYGLGSTTAAEMVRLLEALHQEALISPEASRDMLEHLKACDDRDKFSRLLPEGAIVAFKTGSLDEVRTAAGILYTPGGPVALCVLSAENEDQRWLPDNAGNRLCAEIALAVFESSAAD
jgi:beta-lactamase class A